MELAPIQASMLLKKIRERAAEKNFDSNRLFDTYDENND